MNYSSGIVELRKAFPWPAEIPDMSYNMQGWCDVSLERNIRKYIREALSRKPFVIYAEIGSWFGMSSKVAAEEVGKNGAVICMDGWAGGGEFVGNCDVSISKQQFLRNLWEYRETVVPLSYNSPGCLTILANFGVEPDMLCIDGSHVYGDVLQDLQTSSALFPNTLIFGHDYEPGWPGIPKAVYEFCAHHEFPYTVDRVTYTIHKNRKSA